MKIYDISLKYTLVREEDALLLDDGTKIINYMDGAFDERPQQEQVWVLLVNNKNKLLGRHLVSIGMQTASIVDIKGMLRLALLGHASAIVAVHNHPSGDPTPSRADVAITNQMRQACQAVDIIFHDHIIIGNKADDPSGKGHYSFREMGLC